MLKFTLLVCLATAVALPIACNGPQYGIGQGQPAYPERTAAVAARLPLKIDSVFVAQDPDTPTYTDPNRGYVQLTNQGTAAIDFSQVTLSLLSESASVTLDPASLASLATPLEPGASRALTDAPLASFASVLGYPNGQVVVVDDATSAVQAYIAWGPQALAAPFPAFTAWALDGNAIGSATDSFDTLAAPITPKTSAYIVAP